MEASAAPTRLRSGFTLALGGGGARGYAHLGVAEALAERGLRPGRIVGTSMGAVIGAGLAAGLSPARMAELAHSIDPWRIARRPTRLALFDHRPLIKEVAAFVGQRRIEELEVPFGAATTDLVTGAHRLVVSGSVVEALEKACAISVVFPPIVDGDGVWADAGLWEPVPISLARAWSDEPVVGVQVIWSKPLFFERGPVAWSLRTGARWLGPGADGLGASGLDVRRLGALRLGARRYTALLGAAITRPLVRAHADLLITPDLAGVSWLRFDDVERPRRAGYLAARHALAGVAVDEPTPVPA